jgi:quercetin dioxygenase-like cupin family protein
MPIVYHNDVSQEPFAGGATYRTLVGDKEGSTPVRIGIQESPPGYATPIHSHPYMEILTILAGTGEAWMEGQEGLVSSNLV